MGHSGSPRLDETGGPGETPQGIVFPWTESYGHEIPCPDNVIRGHAAPKMRNGRFLVLITLGSQAQIFRARSPISLTRYEHVTGFRDKAHSNRVWSSKAWQACAPCGGSHAAQEKHTNLHGLGNRHLVTTTR